MKKLSIVAFIALFSFALVSWGVIGHRAIGKIAENHLSPKAALAVKDLLGDQSLADVSTYADEVRSKPEYKYTGAWHYVNMPLGLSEAEFSKKVTGMADDNVYKALVKCEHELINPATSREQKIFDLKFIVHLVGDLHQPMHVSRTEDKGGNSIQLSFNGQGTNLHRLWDSGLIERKGLTFEQMAVQYDKASPSAIKALQADPIIKWLFESYQASSTLYAEVDAMKGRSIEDAYYTAHLPIIEDRIQKGGIRLAGVLNALFEGKPVNLNLMPALDSSVSALAKDSISTYCEKVYGGKYFAKTGTTLLNLGAAFPDHKMTVVIKGADRAKFKGAPETILDGKTVCITGKIIQYNGKPEIIVTDPGQIKVN